MKRREYFPLHCFFNCPAAEDFSQWESKDLMNYTNKQGPQKVNWPKYTFDKCLVQDKQINNKWTECSQLYEDSQAYFRYISFNPYLQYWKNIYPNNKAIKPTKNKMHNLIKVQ